MAKYRIEFDKPGCIGAFACVAVAPESWEQGNDGKAIQKKFECDYDKFQENLEAAKACPVNVIHIYDEKGKKLI